MITILTDRGMSYDLEKIMKLDDERLSRLVDHEYSHLFAMPRNVSDAVREQIGRSLACLEKRLPCPPLVDLPAPVVKENMSQEQTIEGWTEYNGEWNKREVTVQVDQEGDMVVSTDMGNVAYIPMTVLREMMRQHDAKKEKACTVSVFTTEATVQFRAGGIIQGSIGPAFSRRTPREVRLPLAERLLFAGPEERWTVVEEGDPKELEKIRKFPPDKSIP